MTNLILDERGKTAGYFIIQNPDEDITPLSIIKESGNVIGNLSDFFDFPADISGPEIKINELKPDLSKASVKSTDASMDINILNDILKLFHLGEIGTSIKFDKTKIDQMTFNNVLSDSIKPVKLLTYLQKGSLKNLIMVLDLIDKKEKTFLVYDIIKSNSFKLSLTKESSAESKTTVDLLKSVASVKGGAKIEQSDDSSITYSYEKPLPIGVKHCPLGVKKNFWTKKYKLCVGSHEYEFPMTPEGITKVTPMSASTEISSQKKTRQEYESPMTPVGVIKSPVEKSIELSPLSQLIDIEGLYLQLGEKIELGVIEDTIPQDIDLFDYDYTLNPIEFTYESYSYYYYIYCLAKCNDYETVRPYIMAHLTKGRGHRLPLETTYTPMWQNTRDPQYFAYKFAWPPKYENWREPGTYTLELCIGFKSTRAHIGSKPTWLIKSCEENEPKDTSDNPNKFKFTITRYNKR